MREITEKGRARRHARWRRSLAWTTVAVAAAHAALLVFLSLPDAGDGDRSRGDPRLVVFPMSAPPEQAPRRAVVPPVEAGPEEEGLPSERRSGPRAQRPDPRAAIPVVVETPGAPEETTIPSTAIDAHLSAPTLPLEAGPDGIRRRAPRPGTLARMRADSIVSARLADLPGAQRREPGAVGLAEGGGVTIAIPWQGFLPDDRKDGSWRKERCDGKDAGENDKPGEAEGRAGQCG